MRSQILTVIGAIAALAAAALIIVPVSIVILSALSKPSSGFIGAFTLDNLKALGSPQDVGLLVNTVIFTIGASAIAIVLATVLAWINSSTNVPFPRLMQLIPLAPLLMPPLMRDTSWIQLYSPRAGLVNLVIEHVFGIDWPVFNIFSLTGMIVDVGINMVPMAYLIVFPALKSLNRSLDEASRLSGAGTLRTLREITVPIIKPAMLSAFAMLALVVASAFETPVVVGEPAGVGTYMSAIYRALSGGGTPDYNLASAQACIYFVLNAALLTWYLRATRREHMFQTVAGRGYSRAPGYSRWRWMLVLIPLVYFVLSFGQLFVQSLLVSFLPYYTVTQGFPFRTLSFGNYVKLFQQPHLRQAVANSVYVSGLSTIVTVAAAVVLSSIAFQTKIRGRRFVEFIGTLPLAIPPMVFSIALLITVLITPGLNRFYGTLAPLVLVNVVHFLPFAMRIVSASMLQISPELRESAAMSGAGVTRRLATISVPLIGVAVGYAGLLVFVQSFRELAAVVLLVGPDTPLVPSVALDLYFVGEAPMVSALNLVTVAIPAIVFGLVYGAYLLIRSLRRAIQAWRFRLSPAQ